MAIFVDLCAGIAANVWSHLIGQFMMTECSHHLIFLNALNKNIEKTLDITSNIITLGDMNEDLLNPCLHNLKDLLLLNSLQNIKDEPTRQLALLNPIIRHEEMSPLS